MKTRTKRILLLSLCVALLVGCAVFAFAAPKYGDTKVVGHVVYSYRPGGKYAKAKVTISGWQPVKAYDREKGYVEIEFKQGSKVYRLWVPEAYTFITWK